MTATHRTRAHGARYVPTPIRRIARVLATVLCTVAVAACEQITPLIDAIADNLHTLEVVNRCGGPNSTVGMYLNGAYSGTVFYSRDFAVLSGPLTLRAVGTGYSGSVFTDATTVRGDLVWTLCSVGGISTGQELSAD